MRKTFLMNCVLFACLPAASDCFADTRNVEALIDEKLLLPAYKLGGSYKSKDDASVSCLEGHSGAILNNKTCLAGNNASVKACTDSECKKLDDALYYCSKITKKCEEEECTGTTDCAWAYAKALPGLPDVEIDSELRSCVANENKDGGHYCKVTCSLEHIIAKSGLTQAEAARMLNLMRLDMLVYKKPSKAVEYYRELTFDKDNPDANGIWDESKFQRLMDACQSGVITARQGWYSPACMVAQGSTYGYRDETGDIPIYGLGTYPVQFKYYDAENLGKLYERVVGAYYNTSDWLNNNQCVAHRAYTVATSTSWSTADIDRVLRLARRNRDGHAIAESIRGHFKAALNNREAYVSNSALYERLKEPDIYYLGQSPACALYDDSSRAWHYNGNRYSAKQTKYMFYIPQQDVISWRRYKEEDATFYSTKQWDLSTGDRIACCADAHVHGKITGGNAVSCIDLTNDYGVVDIE